jgi:hypothetical protein
MKFYTDIVVGKEGKAELLSGSQEELSHTKLVTY